MIFRHLKPAQRCGLLVCALLLVTVTGQTAFASPYVDRYNSDSVAIQSADTSDVALLSSTLDAQLDNERAFRSTESHKAASSHGELADTKDDGAVLPGEIAQQSESTQQSEKAQYDERSLQDESTQQDSSATSIESDGRREREEKSDGSETSDELSGEAEPHEAETGEFELTETSGADEAGPERREENELNPEESELERRELERREPEEPEHEEPESENHESDDSEQSEQLELEERQKQADALAEQAQAELEEAIEQTQQAEPSLEEQAQKGRVMWRLYNPNSGEHFYTANMTEAKKVAAAGWSWEGVAWVAPTSGDPVYRLYNPNAGDHHYTMSAGERDLLIKRGWKYEGVGWYSDKSRKIKVYRQYNPNAKTGTHNFTVNGNEARMLKRAGWRDEGVAWYALSVSTSEKLGGFWIEAQSGNRAWVTPNGRVQTGKFTQGGATYYAPTSAGWVVRGRVDDGKGHVYLADSKGHLATKTGWMVSSAYGDGMQRYWMEKLSNGVVAAKSGHFTVSGSHYWGIANKGYVLRGKLKMGNGILLADNSGKLAWKSGWLITGTYDGGTLERYYIDNSPGNGMHGAHIGIFSVSGKTYWGNEKHGYVLRNKLITISGIHYWANNDGVMSGLKNGKYGWQNPTGYYQVSSYNVVLPGYSRGIFSYVSPTQVKPGSTREECVEIFVRRAQQYLGTPYVWDYACAPGVGVDCAGLVLQCLYSVGITPNKYTPHDHFYTPGHDHYAVDMRNDPKFMRVSFANRKRGDLIFYAGHVAIYVGGDVIINAVDRQVQYDSVYRWPVLSVSRVLI